MVENIEDFQKLGGILEAVEDAALDKSDASLQDNIDSHILAMNFSRMTAKVTQSANEGVHCLKIDNAVFKPGDKVSINFDQIAEVSTLGNNKAYIILKNPLGMKVEIGDILTLASRKGIEMNKTKTQKAYEKENEERVKEIIKKQEKIYKAEMKKSKLIQKDVKEAIKQADDMD